MQVQTTSAAVNPPEDLALLPLRELAAFAPGHHSPQPLAPPSGQDVSSVLSTEIAGSDLPRLAALLEPHRSVELVAQTHELVHDTEQALAQGDRTRAFANLSQMAATDPRTLAVIAPEKLLESIRPEVDHVLNRLTTVARMDAEGWLSQADHAVETSAHPADLNWQTKPETILNVAHRLFDSGGYTNYVRSADVAQSLLNSGPAPYSPFLAQYAESLSPKPAAALQQLEDDEPVPHAPILDAVGQTAAALKTAAIPSLLLAWKRAPLLVLLLSWLGSGLVAGPVSILVRAIWPHASTLIDFGFEVWALGFLALVGFGFYARIRDIRA
jgi:hypothetical protein